MFQVLIAYLIVSFVIAGFRWLSETSTVKKDLPKMLVMVVLGLAVSYFGAHLLEQVANLVRKGAKVHPFILYALGTAAALLFDKVLFKWFVKTTGLDKES